MVRHAMRAAVPALRPIDGERGIFTVSEMILDTREFNVLIL